jgi:HMG (high mobility group) box
VERLHSSSIQTQRQFQENLFFNLRSDATSKPITTTEEAFQKQPYKCDADTGQQTKQVPPLRPLSAYNYFFRHERERILRQSHDHDLNITSDNYPYTEEQQQELLNEYWSQDRTQKRRHRKTHGKISFTALSKLVSQRWKVLPSEQKILYQHIASKDWKRYQEELTLCKTSVPW